jgi:predicted peptidase
MRTIVSVVCAAWVLGLAVSTTPAQEMKAPQQGRSLKRKITKTVTSEYLIYLPKDYHARSKTRWPLILFLHGAGERGTNLSKVALHGPPKLVKQARDFPFIIVSPQCPANQRWDNEVLLALLDEIEVRYNVDKSRVYLTGLSMGGYGTWSLGLTHPERFAAIAPICGGGDLIVLLLADPKKVSALRTLGVWAFHGGKDPVVPLSESERMVDALRKTGCKDVQLTVYPEAQHDSWTEAYNNPKFYDWFLGHQRKS